MAPVSGALPITTATTCGATSSTAAMSSTLPLAGTTRASAPTTTAGFNQGSMHYKKPSARETILFQTTNGPRSMELGLRRTASTTEQALSSTRPSKKASSSGPTSQVPTYPLSPPSMSQN